MARKAASSTISDLGEKIGGARKDKAVKKGPRVDKGPVDTRPGWQRRFTISEIAKSMRPEEQGKFAIYDVRTKDQRGQPRPATRTLFASQAEAERAVPLLAVSQKHYVRETYGRTADGKIDHATSNYEIWRKVSDKKQVKAVPTAFPTKDAAMAHMASNANVLLGGSGSFGEEIKVKPAKVYREGPKLRTSDVDPKQFLNEFKFRGVEFGNWQGDRQVVVNHAYDAMHDLAQITKISADGLTFNDRLGLAFGARGHGGKKAAAAHYEPDKVAINLTKLSGAGTLAHEWWHGMDHYLGRIDADNKPQSFDRSEIYASHRVATSRSAAALNETVRKAYADLMDTMLNKTELRPADPAPLEKRMVHAKKEIERQVETLRRDLTEQKDPQYYKRNNKPASAEQLAKFDAAAAKLISGEERTYEHRWNDTALKARAVGSTGNGSLAGRWTNDAIDAIAAVNKEVRGRTGFGSGDSHGPLNYLGSAFSSLNKSAAELEKIKANPTQTVKMATDYVKAAKKLDETRSQPYWETRHELAARAFESYVSDRLKEQGRRSDYLVYGVENEQYKHLGEDVLPYPAGDERVAINAKFDTLFEAMRSAQVVKSAAPTAANVLTAMNKANAQAAEAVKTGQSLTPGWSDAARQASAEVRADNATPQLPMFTAKPAPPKELTDMVRRMGAAAQASGLGSAPATDPAFHALLQDNKYKSGDLMGAWEKGWHGANASQVVEGVNDPATLAKTKAAQEARFADQAAQNDAMIRKTLTDNGDTQGLARYEAKQAAFKAEQTAAKAAPKDAQPAEKQAGRVKPAHEVRLSGNKYNVYENGQPIKDSSGKDKWFGSKEKATQYLEKRAGVAQAVTTGKPAGWSDAARAASAAVRAEMATGAKTVEVGHNNPPPESKVQAAVDHHAKAYGAYDAALREQWGAEPGKDRPDFEALKAERDAAYSDLQKTLKENVKGKQVWERAKLDFNHLDKLSLQELGSLHRTIMEDPASRNPDHKAGKSIQIYNKQAKAKLERIAQETQSRVNMKARADAAAKIAAPAAPSVSAAVERAMALSEAKAKAAKPKGGGGHGVSALLGPAFIGAAMLAASTKAKAEGLDTTRQVTEAAKEGAKSTAVIAGFGAGTAIAVKGLMKAGMTAMKAIPAVNVALMAGNAAYEGGSAAMNGASGTDIAKAAARGAWDMSLPGMALNAATAVKDAVTERAALNAQPTARQNNFAVANKAYKAIQHAKAATGNHLKGFQNPATLAAALAAQGKTLPKAG